LFILENKGDTKASAKRASTENQREHGQDYISHRLLMSNNTCFQRFMYSEANSNRSCYVDKRCMALDSRITQWINSHSQQTINWSTMELVLQYMTDSNPALITSM